MQLEVKRKLDSFAVWGRIYKEDSHIHLIEETLSLFPCHVCGKNNYIKGNICEGDSFAFKVEEF